MQTKVQKLIVTSGFLQIFQINLLHRSPRGLIENYLLKLIERYKFRAYNLNSIVLPRSNLIYALVAVFLVTIFAIALTPKPVSSEQGTDYTLLGTWGSKGLESGQFNVPHSLAFDRFGNAYVSDTNNHRIQKFTAKGQFITKWGSKGNATGQFRSPEGIDVDSQGNVYVADTGNSRIQKFTDDGKF